MTLRNNILRKIELKLRLFLSPRYRRLESSILRTICQGKGIDVGCGSSKVSENCIGVDLLIKGEVGKYGSQKGKISQAEIRAEGDNLYMFKNGELDFVVAKHNLEHYANPEKTLLEWKRVLKKGGKVGVIVPDNRFVNARALDPTHKVDFDINSLGRLFQKAGFKIVRIGVAVPHWSIYCIAEKV